MKLPKKLTIAAAELILAEALAAAHAAGLEWCRSARFREGRYGAECAAETAGACCALGGLQLAGYEIRGPDCRRIYIGNDWFTWTPTEGAREDMLESIGGAFAEALGG